MPEEHREAEGHRASDHGRDYEQHLSLGVATVDPATHPPYRGGVTMTGGRNHGGQNYDRRCDVAASRNHEGDEVLSLVQS